MRIRQKYNELVIEGVDTISELNTFYIQNRTKFDSARLRVTPSAYADFCFLIWPDKRMSELMGIPYKMHPVDVECHVDHPGHRFRGVELEIV